MSELTIGPYHYESNFAWGDASPRSVLAVPINRILYSVKVVVLTAFNSDGAAISVGITGETDLFMSTSENDPTVIGEYETNPGYKFTESGIILLSITPGSGASAGNGVILISY